MQIPTSAASTPSPLLPDHTSDDTSDRVSYGEMLRQILKPNPVPRMIRTSKVVEGNVVKLVPAAVDPNRLGSKQHLPQFTQVCYSGVIRDPSRLGRSDYSLYPKLEGGDVDLVLVLHPDRAKPAKKPEVVKEAAPEWNS
ncbi:hypothetical protein Unana1_03828 [Umbelopsis nana]